MSRALDKVSTVSRRVSTLPKVALQVGLSLLLVLAPGCRKAPPAPPEPTPFSQPTSVKSAGPDRVAEAESYAEQARLRLTQVFQDDAFNGYSDLSRLKATPGGLLSLAQTFEREGEAEFFQALPAEAFDDEEQALTHPLFEDFRSISEAIGKPTVTAGLKLDAKGPAVVPHSEAFRKTMTAMTLIPKIESRHQEPEDRIQGCLFTVKAGRKVSLNAATMEHYTLGLQLQESGLHELKLLITSRTLGALELRQIVGGLQEALGSDEELLPIFDAEYLFATLKLKSQGLDEATYSKEQRELATNFLSLRPHFFDPAPPPSQPTSGTTSEFAEHLEILARSRRAATHLAAVELMAALEAYQKDHGSYPDQLEILTSSILSRIPSDKLSQSGTFEYKANDSSYTLKTVPQFPVANEETILW